ncbi:MAG TPA: hypothetical protein PK169_00600, partial [Bacilli bacterium]|nr:hypothetical protein [Bacilli bacterium]
LKYTFIRGLDEAGTIAAAEDSDWSVLIYDQDKKAYYRGANTGKTTMDTTTAGDALQDFAFHLKFGTDGLLSTADSENGGKVKLTVPSKNGSGDIVGLDIDFTKLTQFANESNPLEAMYKHFFHSHIDIAKIKEAMGYIVGRHDFKSFSKNKLIKDTVRTIESFELEVKNNELIFKIIGDGFMHNMVRIIVALMLKVGEGKYEPSAVKQIIEGRSRKLVPYVAPASGLYLVKVYYE